MRARDLEMSCKNRHFRGGGHVDLEILAYF